MVSSSAQALVALEQSSDQRFSKSGGPVKQFVDQVQHSLLYQFNTADSLYALPSTLSHLSVLCATSADRKSSDVTLQSTTGEWKHVQVGGSNVSLRACLTYVADLGLRTMVESQTRINETSNITDGFIQQMLGTVREMYQLPNHANSLQSALEMLTAQLDKGIHSVAKVEDSQDAWLLSITELYQSIAAAQNITDVSNDAELSYILNLQADTVAISQAKATKAQGLEQAAQNLLTHSTAIRQILLDLNDRTPSGWEVSVGSINEILAQIGPSVVAQSLPQLFDAATGQQNLDKQVFRSPLSIAPSTRAPPFHTEYTWATLLDRFLVELQACLSQATEKGPGWVKLYEQGGHAGIDWLHSNIKALQKAADSGSSEPGKYLQGAVSKAVQVIETMKASSTASADQISAWQRDVIDARIAALRLTSTGNSFPGAANGRIVSRIKTTLEHIEAADAPAQAAALTTTVERILSNKQSLLTAQQTNNLATKEAQRSRRNTEDFQARLKELQGEANILTRARGILLQSAAPVALLRAQNLRLRALLASSRTIISNILQPRIQQLGRDPSCGGKDYIRDYEVSSLISSILQVRALVGLAKDISAMNEQFWIRYGRQGLQMISEMSEMASEGDMDRMQRLSGNVFDLTQRACAEAEENFVKKQRDVVQALDEKVGALHEQTQDLQRYGVAPPEGTILQAIQQGSAVVSDFVEQNTSRIFVGLKTHA